MKVRMQEGADVAAEDVEAGFRTLALLLGEERLRTERAQAVVAQWRGRMNAEIDTAYRSRVRGQGARATTRWRQTRKLLDELTAALKKEPKP